jgi:hypothetical protein
LARCAPSASKPSSQTNRLSIHFVTFLCRHVAHCEEMEHQTAHLRLLCNRPRPHRHRRSSGHHRAVTRHSYTAAHALRCRAHAGTSSAWRGTWAPLPPAPSLCPSSSPSATA